MSKRIFFMVAPVLAVVLAACSPDAERVADEPATGPEVEVVLGLMEAFNNHDADAMRSYWAPDVTWIELSGDETTVVTSSAVQLYKETRAYFDAFPTVQSGLENIAVNGNYVSAIERPVWEQDGERKSQASVVVYEIENGKVQRFWYYPPQ